jgi:hypothetical protein
VECRSIAFEYEITQRTLEPLIVGELRGRWDDEAGLNQGVVERDRAIVYVSIESVEDLEPEEVQQVRSRLGAAPLALVVLRVGRAPGSSELAEHVTERLQEALRGVVVSS